MHARSHNLFFAVALLLVSSLASCQSDDVKHDISPTDPKEGLKLLKFTNYVQDVTADLEYFGKNSHDETVFDPVMLYGVKHGQSKSETSFKLGGRPVKPEPTTVVLMGGGGGEQFTRTVTASTGHYIESVDTTWVDRTNVTVIAFNDDGTRATVK